MENNLTLCKENATFFPFSINKEIDEWLPQEERVSFPKSFSYLRKKLQIKQSRKTHIDSILKKCKARFFKAISDCLKQCVKIQIKKFPQSFITNISIEYNKYILNLTVCELYKSFKLSNGISDKCNENCFISGKYIIYESEKKGKEYNGYTDDLIFEGEYLNGKRNGKVEKRI